MFLPLQRRHQSLLGFLAVLLVSTPNPWRSSQSNPDRCFEVNSIQLSLETWHTRKLWKGFASCTLATARHPRSRAHSYTRALHMEEERWGERKREEVKRGIKRATERNRDRESETERERQINKSIPCLQSSISLEKNSSSHVVGELTIKSILKILPTRQSVCTGLASTFWPWKRKKTKNRTSW